MGCWSVLKTIAFQVVEVKEEVWSPYYAPAAHVQNGWQGKGSAFSVMDDTDPLNGTLLTLPVHCHSSLSYCEAKWVGPASVVFIQVAYFEKKKKNDPQGKHSIQNQFSVKDALAEQWHPQNWNLFDYEDTWCMFDVHMVPGDSCCILREDVHLQVIRTVVLCSPTHACLNVTWLHDRTGGPYW